MSLIISRSRPARWHAGFGLLEVILVFALVLAAGAITFSVYRSAQSSAEASKEADHATLIVANLRSGGFATSSGYSGLTIAKAINGHAIPADMIDANGTTAHGAWGAVTLSGNFFLPNGKFGFRLTFEDVPTDACVKLVAASTQYFNHGYILVGTNALEDPDTGAVAMADVVERCGEADTMSLGFVGS